MTRSFSFSDIADVFVREGFLLSPSECHGWGCGLMAGGQRFSAGSWKQPLQQFVGEDVPAVVESILEAFFELALQQFEEGFSLKLLLPEDDYVIADRSQMLGDWCGGFLHGFATVQGESNNEEVREILRDLAQISRIEADAEGENASPEEDFAQLVEFVRMAAITLFLEFNKVSGVSHERH